MVSSGPLTGLKAQCVRRCIRPSRRIRGEICQKQKSVRQGNADETVATLKGTLKLTQVE